MTVPASYPTSPTKRTRRTKAKIEALKADLHQIVQANRPMTIRQIFYQAVVAGLIEKTEAEYANTVSRLLVKMRRDGELPYWWVSDSTRWVRRPRSYPDPDAFVEEVLAGYRRAFWTEQPTYCEVWCEKEALAGTIVDVTAEFDVPLLVSKGFSSDSYLYEAAVQLAEQHAAERFCSVFILTDYDPSGSWIARTIERRLHELARDLTGGRHPTDYWLTIERLAVTESQIATLDLPTRPTKRDGNTHARDWGDRPSVELDAIPAPVLREIVREAILGCIEEGTLEEHREQEKRDREALDIVRRAAALGDRP